MTDYSLPFSYIQVITPTLPSPFKVEGLGGGEKWDFLYYEYMALTRVIWKCSKMLKKTRQVLYSILYYDLGDQSFMRRA